MVPIWACLKREAISEHGIAGYPQRNCGTPEYTHGYQMARRDACSNGNAQQQCRKIQSGAETRINNAASHMNPERSGIEVSIYVSRESKVSNQSE